MPFMMTDVAEGQKAALNMQVAPTLAAETLAQAPLETQKLQLQLDTSRQALDKSKMDMAVSLGKFVDDESVKNEIKGLYTADPTLKDKPISDQALKMGQLLLGRGHIPDGTKLLKAAEESQLHEATMKAKALERDELHAEELHRLIANMDPTNMEQTWQQARVIGHASEPQIATLKKVFQDDFNAGIPFEETQARVAKQTGSVKGDIARQKAIQEQLNSEEKIRHDRAMEADRKLTQLRLEAALRESQGRSGENLSLRRDAIEQAAKARQATVLSSQIRTLSEEENRLTDNAQVKQSAFDRYMEAHPDIPRDPETNSKYQWSTKAEKETFKRYKTLKDAAEAAQTDASISVPTSRVAKIRERMDKLRDQLDNPDGASAPTPKKLTPAAQTALIEKANKAIQAGADPVAVRKRLEEAGVQLAPTPK